VHNPPRRCICRVRWREYVGALYPGLHLSRSKTDLCDRCVRIDIELNTPDISVERKSFLEQDKKLHVDEAIEQRRVWANFVCDYYGRADPNLQLQAEVFPILMEDDSKHTDDLLLDANNLEHLSGDLDLGESRNTEEINCDKYDDATASTDRLAVLVGSDEKSGSRVLSRVALQAEGYGGSIALPQYDYRRPSTEYFN